MNEWSAKPKQRMTAAKWLLLAVFANLAKTSKTEISALSAPYRACTALLDRNTVYAVTTQNRGLWRVAVGILKSGKAALVILPISNRGITAGGYPVISGWGLIRSPFVHSKRGKPHIFPRKIGVMSVRVQICSRKIPGTLPLVAMLCKVTFQIEPLKDEIRCLAALPCLCNV